MLQRGFGQHLGIGQRAQQQPHLHALPRQQLGRRTGKPHLDRHRTGGGIDLRIDEDQFTLCPQRAVGTVKNLGRHLALRTGGGQLRPVLLRHAGAHVERPGRKNRGEGFATGLHQAAGTDRNAPDATG